MVRTLSVTVTVSPLVTGDPSTCIDTESTGELTSLGVQLKEDEVPVVRRVHGVEGGWEQLSLTVHYLCCDIFAI